MLRQGLPPLGLAPDEDLVTRLARFLRLLAKWNRAFNLTSIRDLETMVPLHILDALTARNFLQGQRILDVGCGAGLPGIPLALTEPSRHFTLVDATLKKVTFVRQALAELGLANARAEHARIQDFSPEEQFHTVMCRAFTALPNFIRSAECLLAPGGQFLAMKGRWPAEELANLPPGWQPVAVTRVRLPGRDEERHIVQVGRSAPAAP